MGHYATTQQVWAGGLVFLRVGALVMLIPGIGESYVPPRVRLSFALLLSLCLWPIAAPTLPALPTTLDGMVGQAIKELLIGLMMGGLLRTFLQALSVTGEVVSLQTTLAFAQTANPMEAQPGTTVATFLVLMGVTLIFATDLHHLFLSAIAHSYSLFPPAKHLPLGDAAQLEIQTVGKTFAMGIQLAAPVMAFALVFNIATGLVGRVMPQFQIFFAAAPLALLLGLSVFALSLGLVGLIWLQGFETFLRLFT